MAFETRMAYITLALRSQKIRIADTSGALSRIVTLVPKYMISNFCSLVLLIRQSGVARICATCRPNQTRAIYWSSKTLPLQIEYRLGDESHGYSWSDCVILSENSAGETHMSVESSRDDVPKNFIVRICPDNGSFSIAIAPLTVEITTKTNSGVVFINQCPKESGISVSVKASHFENDNRRPSIDTTSTHIIGPEMSQPIAWSRPFVSTNRMVNSSETHTHTHFTSADYPSVVE